MRVGIKITAIGVRWLYIVLYIGVLVCPIVGAQAQTRLLTPNQPQPQTQPNAIQTGAAQTNLYLPLLRSQSIGVLTHAASRVGNTHLVDTLLRSGVQIVRVFSPEHGFAGTAAAGEKITHDSLTSTAPSAERIPKIIPNSIPEVISLYGEKRQPSPEDLEGITLMVVDLQDVGTRFYTYLSTMHYVLTACAIANIDVLILDRPNPNGRAIDGPLLDSTQRSFVGIHPILLQHGLTLGELAQMINQEGWLGGGRTCNLRVIKVANWSHDTPYDVPYPPSPNLRTDLAIGLYPTLCLFEGTALSVGRGTDMPFEVVGCPDRRFGRANFTVKAGSGAKYAGQRCYGWRFRRSPNKLAIRWWKKAYRRYQRLKLPTPFFNAYFDKLAGNTTLRQQIIAKKSCSAIRKSWEADKVRFEQRRARYLLYP